MMQKEARRGRPPKFDRDAVIDAAVDAFHRSGYDDTTLTDLEQTIGVDRSTLYNSFGGKRGLYDLATNAYLDRAEQRLFSPLHDENTNGYVAILDLLENLRVGLTSPDAIPGCLIVNDMAAGSAPEAAARYRKLLQGGLLAALGRTGDPAAESRARLLTATILGINLISRATADPNQIEQVVDDAVATVTSWHEAGR